MKTKFQLLTGVSKVPMVVSINEIYKKAVVMPDDTIKARPMCNVNILVDHRFCDGGRSKSLNKLVKFFYLRYNI
jgi:pyruvate/2-oxoglutarate dehydrogenase complex dihydrolipoamide acyltransferase (E2) component